ncbi:MAG: hypothetical protein R2941_06605 [Desulfobacterales bacterium]
MEKAIAYEIERQERTC